MLKMIRFVLFGYLSGSVLYARVFAGLFHKEELLACSKDQNPGTANAFQYGGFWCGLLTLLGDLLKGFVPVFAFSHSRAYLTATPLFIAFALAAPVIGHVFPVFYGFCGGKGIAVTFGSLLGLAPNWRPVLTLAFCFLFFSLVVRVTPHFHRTLVSYLCCAVLLLWRAASRGVWIGFFIITCTVCARLLLSEEKREKMEVKLIWKC